MILPQILTVALGVTPLLKYPTIFFATSLGGPTLILASGFLLRLGLLQLIPLFLAIGLGELLLDTLWYYLGYHYADTLIGTYGRFIKFTPESYQTIKSLFTRYQLGILFASKVLAGFGMIIAILITAGATRIPFKKYILIVALGESIWLSIMLTLGYFLGELYTHVAKNLQLAFLIITPCTVLTFIFILSRYARTRIMKEGTPR